MALQAAMLEWSTGAKDRPVYDGTLRSLVRLYETDPDSPYRDLKPTTGRTYSKTLAKLMASVGSKRIDAISGADVRRWYKKLCEDHSVGWAYYSISVLKAVVSYGATLGKRYEACAVLRAQISAARFQQPSARKVRLTYAQIGAFRRAAHMSGKPSMALGVTLQFECAFRQIDVIGEWVNHRWGNGLTWSHIGPDGVLRKVTTKTGAPAAHRIADYPELEAELARISIDHRVGPIVLNEQNGLPYTPAKYRYWFRKIAQAAGIPDDIRSMDARAGAVTEAYEAGATTEGAMALATHTQASTSRRYLRDTTEAGSKVARLRVGSRKP